jgi:hypothetical protein
MAAMKIKTRVLPGRRIEVETPELKEGDLVDVVVSSSEQRREGGLLDFLKSLPEGPRSASTWDEIEGQLAKDRENWRD